MHQNITSDIFRSFLQILNYFPSFKNALTQNEKDSTYYIAIYNMYKF